MRFRLVALCAASLVLGCTQQPNAPAPKRSDDSVTENLVRNVGNPFPDASEVRLFVESGEYGSEGHPILSSPEGRRLTDDQRRAFEAALRIEPMPEEMAACFIPHHFFRYFDSEGRQVGEIAVCFCCAGVEIDGNTPVPLQTNEIFGADFGALERFVQSIGEPTDIACD